MAAVEGIQEDCDCIWTDWMNNDDYSPIIGDNNTYNNLRSKYDFCTEPRGIECRTKQNPTIPFSIGGQKGINCDVTSGLFCQSRKKDFVTNSKPFYCRDYEIKVECCECTIPTTTTISTTAAETTTKSLNRNETATLLNMEPRTQEIDPMENLIPLAIILGVIVFCMIMIGIILFVARKRNQKNKTHHNNSKKKKGGQSSKKVGHIYTHGELRDFQKPVSFNSFEDVFGLREDRSDLYRKVTPNNNSNHSTESTRYSYDDETTPSESSSRSRTRQLKYVESPTVEKIKIHNNSGISGPEHSPNSQSDSSKIYQSQQWLKDETQLLKSSPGSSVFLHSNDSTPVMESFFFYNVITLRELKFIWFIKSFENSNTQFFKRNTIQNLQETTIFWRKNDPARKIVPCEFKFPLGIYVIIMF